MTLLQTYETAVAAPVRYDYTVRLDRLVFARLASATNTFDGWYPIQTSTRELQVEERDLLCRKAKRLPVAEVARRLER